MFVLELVEEIIKGEKRMKFCGKCGAQLVDEAVVCPKCGCAQAPITRAGGTNSENDSLNLVIKIFMIIGCISWAFCFIVPLAWCIPMTVTVFRKLDAGEPMTTGFKVCVLLFVSLISGIILLVKDDQKGDRVS